MSVRVLLIDVGNSRIKWGWRDADGRLAADVEGVDTALADRTTLSAAWQRAQHCVYCCVAGEAADRVLRAALPAGCRSHRIRAAANACGIDNLYHDPVRLGADRWAALIGARTLLDGALVVVCAGTATTVDALDAGDRFLGGYILPGVDLMMESLARRTADLPLARGQATQWPRNTDDAIFNGCVGAQVALIERVRQRMGDARIVLSGGGSEALWPQFADPPARIDHLVLHGLARMAGDVLK
ncbi:type III pantothenate kinase [Methyloversatilis thermotolerans]|uniref:type III pantothenate kinase n=1 Tax=Methyloversatilis thermotolerans TaxID=1346290 RepID=UPI00035D1E2D|nr:type III pantothenate kinase [Methyloversatilis thermotolerans]